MFKGLLPPICDEPAQRVLYLLAQWHGLAKLRLHTEATLKALKQLTAQFGNEIRAFAQLTQNLNVRETPKEYQRRRKQYEAARSRSKSKRPASSQKVANDGRRRCTLNLETYKFHSMGDYVRCIERYGSSDSYSTQIVCHRYRFLFVISQTLTTFDMSRMNCITAASNFSTC